ncbi:MAG: Re/Si-specific NAD(P)(+) transhydrogenase subunit alpha [Desulfobulbaceae bacterium]|uniref:NAD(P) transhydrogenase subunit alpha part 1 n=1 Tax=Candidatus Desulfatifera sulfidica TaxID=2841691 RepID=A0A8J6N9V3_9BACT|nr:Re/Si-specific NAD(P)(+) transhydrogenase subunit alpha [Candidatus Desulfatifera sulfidica]
MKLAVLKEIEEGENRVAVIPDSIKRLNKNGFDVLIESGAGLAAGHSDQDYQDKGATILATAQELMNQADCVVKVRPPTLDEAAMLKDGSTLIAVLQSVMRHDLVKLLSEKKITSFGLDVIPRTSLAQAMDVLSSMSTIAGYKSVLMAADTINKFFPMLMTAAGTVAPAKVLVLGAGVAGLMACSTAKRLGGVVEAFDVRPEVKEQVHSVGAKFIEVPIQEDGSGSGGYAKEMSDEYKKKQGELISKHIAKSDVVIPTALIPGRKAPILISEEQVKSMKPGSIIVDIAAEMGGNCALTQPGETIIVNGVTIIGHSNLPSTMSFHASQMFSKNVEKFLFHLCDENGFKMDMDDEITSGSLVTRDGAVVHELTKKLMDA